MTLEKLGYNNTLEKYRENQNLSSFDVGRVVSEHKDRYKVINNQNEYEAELIGSLRFSAQSIYDFPVVGDWVSITQYDDDKALIHHVFERQSLIERQAVGKKGAKQIIASNIDFALIVQSVDRDFNLNRLERYLTICNASNVKPLIVLSKIDLVGKEELEGIINNVKLRVGEKEIFVLSNHTQSGIKILKDSIVGEKTYCLLGSSGVGKSSLLNSLLQKNKMATDHIGEKSNRGRHVTTQRSLVLLEGGGIFIDNPGMREVGIADADKGLEITFDQISKLSQDCKFRDCTHIQEKGCAVLEAIDEGNISTDLYNNFLKLQKETTHFDSTIAERKQKDKQFSKLIKRTMTSRKAKKY